MEHDDAGTEERKPFDADVVKEEEDTQPEPDEVLSMDSGGGRVWSVKVCILHDMNDTTLSTRHFTDPKTPHGKMVRDRRRRQTPRHDTCLQ